MQYWWRKFCGKTCVSKLAISVAAVGVGAAFPALLPASGTVIGSILGGVGQNLLSNVFDRWFAKDSLPAGDHLNHDIELVVGRAIEGVLQELIDADSPHKAVYKEMLGAHAAMVWREMLAAEEFNLDIPDPQQLLFVAAQIEDQIRAASTEGGANALNLFNPFPSALDEATWKAWLVRLDSRCGIQTPLGESELNELAPALVSRFYWHLLQALKKDFVEDGKAYAAVQMATAHSVLAIVRDQTEQLSQIGLKLSRIEAAIVGKANIVSLRLDEDQHRVFTGWFEQLSVKLDYLKYLAEQILEHQKATAQLVATNQQLAGTNAQLATHSIATQSRLDSVNAERDRLEAALREAQRLAESGNAEFEQALAEARQTKNADHVINLLRQLHDRELQQERVRRSLADQRIVEASLQIVDHDMRNLAYVRARDRLLETVQLIPLNWHLLVMLGRAHVALLQYPQALNVFRKALPLNDDRRDQSLVIDEIGYCLLLQGDRRESAKFLNESLEICREIVKRFGETPEALRDVSVSLNKVGDVERAENGAKSALPLYRESLEIRREIVKRFGETPQALRDVSVSLNKVGDVERAENGAKSALPLYRESLEISREIVKRFGETPQALRDVSVSLDRVGDVERAENGAKSALPLYRESLEIRREIVKRFGETPQALRDVSVSLDRVGDVELAENGAKSALPLYRESLEICREIVKRFGETPEALRDVSVSLNKVGDVERAENGAKSALPLYRESLEIRREIVKRFGETPQALRDVSVSLDRVGDVERAENGAKSALPLYRESLEISREIVKRFGETPQALRDVSVSLDRVGDVERAENGAKSALPLYRESLEIRREIVKRFGETPQALRDVSVSLDRVGDVELAENGAKSALPLYRESLEICREIVKRFGETPEALRDVSVSLDRVGDVERAENGAKSALPLYRESLEIRREIVKRFGETPQALREVVMSLYRTALAVAQESQLEAALTDAQEALQILEQIAGRWGMTPSLGKMIDAVRQLIDGIEGKAE